MSDIDKQFQLEEKNLDSYRSIRQSNISSIKDQLSLFTNLQQHYTKILLTLVTLFFLVSGGVASFLIQNHGMETYNFALLVPVVLGYAGGLLCFWFIPNISLSEQLVSSLSVFLWNEIYVLNKHALKIQNPEEYGEYLEGLSELFEIYPTWEPLKWMCVIFGLSFFGIAGVFHAELAPVFWPVMSVPFFIGVIFLIKHKTVVQTTVNLFQDLKSNVLTTFQERKSVSTAQNFRLASFPKLKYKDGSMISSSARQ